MQTFIEWLFLENATVAQRLKMSKDPNVPEIKAAVRAGLQKFEAFRDLGADGEFLVNFMTKVCMDEFGSHIPAGAEPGKVVAFVSHSLGHSMRNWGDFIFATWQTTKSKLNSPAYTVAQIKVDSDRWHEDMAARKAQMPSEEYRALIDLGGGWKWVSLGRGYCSAEAKAMGHCGNSGAVDGDDILSLRDPSGQAHLTFILNGGMLGEMKGRGNAKPSNRYHPAIVELLKHPSVHSIKGGGYAPERNFSLKDLDEVQRKMLEKLKPDIGNPIMYMLKAGKNQELATELGMTDGDDISLEGGEVVLAKFKELEDLGRIVSGPAFQWWFGDDRNRHDGGGFDVSWRDAEGYADAELEELMVKVAKKEGDEAEDA